MALAVFALATLCLGARVDGFVDEIVDLDTLDEGPGSEERVQALKLKVLSCFIRALRHQAKRGQ